MKITTSRAAALRRGWATRPAFAATRDRIADRMLRKLERRHVYRGDRRVSWAAELEAVRREGYLAGIGNGASTDQWTYDCETGWHPESQKSREASPQRED